MNDVQRFILTRAMNKVASKDMQKEANPLKNAWEKGTDWLAENLFLSEDEKLRRDWLDPNEPVTLRSDSMPIVGTHPDGSPEYGLDISPIYDRLSESPKIQHHKNKMDEIEKTMWDLKHKDSPWANLKLKYYRKQYDKHSKKRWDLQDIIDNNRNTPYVDFRKQHPEFFEK